MDLEKLNEIALQRMGSRMVCYRGRGHTYNHSKRVAKLSLNLRKAIYPDYTTDDDILYIGALYHDIGRGIEPHAKTGGLIIRSIIGDFCSEAELQKITQIITLHNARGDDKQDKLIKIVQDADVLDHFGTHNVWQTFIHTYDDGKQLNDALEYYKGDIRKDFVDKLYNLLNYEISKQIMKKRVQETDTFIDRTILEQNGKYII